MSAVSDPARSIRVLIADDHPVVREGLRTLVSQAEEMEVVAEAADGREAAALAQRLQPHVALVDLRMPNVNGIEAITSMLECAPGVRAIVLTTYSGDEDVFNAFRAGAKAYLLKDAPRDELLSCIRAVHEGRSWVSSVAVDGLATYSQGNALTPRERDVLRLIVEGKSNKEIAATLRVAVGTVKAHVNRVLRKLQVSSRSEAIMQALRRGLVHVEDGPTQTPRGRSSGSR